MTPLLKRVERVLGREGADLEIEVGEKGFITIYLPDEKIAARVAQKFMAEKDME